MTIELNIRKNAEEGAEVVKENATDPESVTGQDHEAAPETDADHVVDHVTDTGKEDVLGHVHGQGAGTEVETEIGIGEEGEEKNQHHYHLNHSQERQVFDINTIYFSSVYPEAVSLRISMDPVGLSEPLPFNYLFINWIRKSH